MLRRAAGYGLLLLLNPCVVLPEVVDVAPPIARTVVTGLPLAGLSVLDGGASSDSRFQPGSLRIDGLESSAAQADPMGRTVHINDNDSSGAVSLADGAPKIPTPLFGDAAVEAGRPSSPWHERAVGAIRRAKKTIELAFPTNVVPLYVPANDDSPRAGTGPAADLPEGNSPEMHPLQVDELRKAATLGYAYVNALPKGDVEPLFTDVNYRYLGDFVRVTGPSSASRIEIFECVLKDPGPGAGGPSKIQWPKMILEYDGDSGIARPLEFSTPEARYVAFGDVSYAVKNGVGQPRLRNAFIVPISDPDMASQLSVWLSKKRRSDPVMPLVLEGKSVEGNNGKNLPWLGWRVEDLRLSSDPALPEPQPTERGRMRLPSLPIALLDEQGRVIVGEFPTADLEIPTPSADWGNNIATAAQEALSAKFASPPGRVAAAAEELRSIWRRLPARSDYASFSWRGDGSSAVNKAFRFMSPLTMIVSGTIGKVKGWGRNPNYKYNLEFTDPSGQLNLQVIVQNNIQDLIGRPIRFGGRTDGSEPFRNSDGFGGTEPVTVKFGFGKVRGYLLYRIVPRGTLLIESIRTDAKGRLIGITGNMDFEVDRWADVHPAGRIRIGIHTELDRVPRRPKIESCRRGLMGCGDEPKQTQRAVIGATRTQPDQFRN